MRTIAEFFCQVIKAVLPLVKIHAAEAATGFDVLGFRLPCVHTGSHLAAVHESQVLSKMVFPVEGSGFWAFFVTGGVIVGGQMFLAGVQLIAVYTSGLSGSFIGDNLAQRCT
jgi:hypothetical protein